MALMESLEIMLLSWVCKAQETGTASRVTGGRRLGAGRKRQRGNSGH